MVIRHDIVDQLGGKCVICGDVDKNILCMEIEEFDSVNYKNWKFAKCESIQTCNYIEPSLNGFKLRNFGEYYKLMNFNLIDCFGILKQIMC